MRNNFPNTPAPRPAPYTHTGADLADKELKDQTAWARWFRDSTPYIRAHRGRTFVVLLGDEAMSHSNLTNIVHDLALLQVLGVRLVIVHGARAYIDATLTESQFHNGRRVTTAAAMDTITGIYGTLRARLEALFSTGLPTSPLHNADIAVVSGNFVTARPVGVLDGVDHLFTGRTRSVHAERINNTLEHGAIVLLSPMGYSTSGQPFNLASVELCADVAARLGADKLIVFDNSACIRDAAGDRLSVLTPGDADRESGNSSLDDITRGHLAALARAVRGGVGRGHLVSYQEDGALLAELFTARGVGTQVTEEASRWVRPAVDEDVAGIVELIRPLEDAGQLVRRSRDRLEQEINRFLVAEVDGIVVGCCAVYPFGNDGDTCELACIAVHESFRKGFKPSLGARLLAAAEDRARKQNARRVFALTTEARDWFIDLGFELATVADLPDDRQTLYNYQRNSHVLVKPLK